MSRYTVKNGQLHERKRRDFWAEVDALAESVKGQVKRSKLIADLPEEKRQRLDDLRRKFAYGRITEKQLVHRENHLLGLPGKPSPF